MGRGRSRKLPTALKSRSHREGQGWSAGTAVISSLGCLGAAPTYARSPDYAGLPELPSPGSGRDWGSSLLCRSGGSGDHRG